jgi:hypothetical protein
MDPAHIRILIGPEHPKLAELIASLVDRIEILELESREMRRDIDMCKSGILTLARASKRPAQ